MGLLKPRGQSASDIRKGTLHGSTAQRRMAKWGGRIQRRGEKPGNWDDPSGPPPRRWGR